MESLQQFLIEILYRTQVRKVEEQFLFDISYWFLSKYLYFVFGIMIWLILSIWSMIIIIIEMFKGR